MNPFIQKRSVALVETKYGVGKFKDEE